MKLPLKSALIALCFACALISCGPRRAASGWTAEETALICAPDSVMRVLTVDVLEDSLVLRDSCRAIDDDMLLSEEYPELCRKMVATVTSPEQDGVGIAGPQVGISRRIVAVMRYDREGMPFEVYPNVRVTAVRGEREYGPEGCLSIPGRRGDVLRWRDIDVTYSRICRPAGSDAPVVKDTTESVTGYTAIIFQHECDHLDGVLYTDLL